MPQAVARIQSPRSPGWSVRHFTFHAASIQFFRNTGGTVGTAVLGTILTSGMATAIPGYLPVSEDGTQPHVDADAGSVLDPQTLAQLPPEVVEAVRHGLADALHGVFLTAIPLVLIALVASLLVKSIPLRTTLHDTEPGTDAAAQTPPEGHHPEGGHPVGARHKDPAHRGG